MSFLTFFNDTVAIQVVYLKIYSLHTFYLSFWRRKEKEIDKERVEINIPTFSI